MPIAVEYPFRAEHVTRVTLPGPYDAARENRALLDSTFRFNVEASSAETW